jgi:zinc transporter ZupT
MFKRCTNFSLKFSILFWAFIFLGALAFSSEAGVKNPAKNLSSVGEKQNYLPILNRWSGDYPIVQLDRLKDWHAQAHVGFIGDEAAFASFWEAFKKDTAVPRVDFSKNLVVFVMGDGSYKQMFIAKVTLKDNIAEMVADGNTSGLSCEDSLAMALAVIPRAGVKFVRVGKEQIALE